MSHSIRTHTHLNTPRNANSHFYRNRVICEFVWVGTMYCVSVWAHHTIRWYTRLRRTDSNVCIYLNCNVLCRTSSPYSDGRWWVECWATAGRMLGHCAGRSRQFTSPHLTAHAHSHTHRRMQPRLLCGAYLALGTHHTDSHRSSPANGQQHAHQHTLTMTKGE